MTTMGRMPDWVDFFIPSVNLGELFLRGTVTYVGLMLLLRVVGRREAGGLGLTDLLVILLIVDAASIGMTGEAGTLGDSFVLVITVLLWSVVFDALTYRWPRLGSILKAPPRQLIEDGELNHRAMRRELMSRAEVESQLRLHGIEDLSNVHRAHIEPNGMVSVTMRKPPETPDAPKSPEL